MGNTTSRKLSAGTRVYYFDINTDRKGQKFLSISEIPTDRHPGDKDRQRIFVHAESIDGFISELTAAVEDMRKCQ